MEHSLSRRSRADGTPPEDFAEEARQAWRNAQDALKQAGVAMTDIVSVRTWLTDTSTVRSYVDVRNPKPPETPGGSEQ
ncbi:RidA family protein [Streptosporangium sp. 'caverna']|uniref:RidA family protein n=1 Tax=Streptosporangium sp. 'caverna' TaxID=2202249 RepID=UPI001EF7CB52|nr:RidA family protein [Streptosporangium sp. 'caverna']